MDSKIINKIITTEKEFHKWFISNYRLLGYNGIVRKDVGIFPDFIMNKDGKDRLVELETLSSNFLSHKHDQSKVDELVCIHDNLPSNTLNIPIISVNSLKFKPRVERISATIDPETNEIIENMLKKGIYRNKSHVLEEAIKSFAKEVKNEK